MLFTEDGVRLCTIFFMLKWPFAPFFHWKAWFFCADVLRHIQSDHDFICRLYLHMWNLQIRVCVSASQIIYLCEQTPKRCQKIAVFRLFGASPHSTWHKAPRDLPPWYFTPLGFCRFLHPRPPSSLPHRCCCISPRCALAMFPPIPLVCRHKNQSYAPYHLPLAIKTTWNSSYWTCNLFTYRWDEFSSASSPFLRTTCHLPMSHPSNSILIKFVSMPNRSFPSSSFSCIVVLAKFHLFVPFICIMLDCYVLFFKFSLTLNILVP